MGSEWPAFLRVVGYASTQTCSDEPAGMVGASDPVRLCTASTPVPLPAENGKIAFSSSYPGIEPKIYKFDPNGTGGRRISHNVMNDLQPAWSPDGIQVAFTRGNGLKLQVFKMNADGTNIVRLMDNFPNDMFPAWSPKGYKIAFQASVGTHEEHNNDDYEIYKMNPDGSNRVRVTDNKRADVSPSWGVHP